MAIIASWSGTGISGGATVGTSTAGVGDAPFDAVTAGAFTITDAGLHSPRVQVDQQAATNAQLTWSTTITGALTSYAIRMYVELSGYPSSGARLIDARDNLNVLLWYVDVNSSGLLRLKDPAGVAVDTTAMPVPLDTELRVEVVGDAGDVTVTVYTGDSATATDTLTGSGLGTTFQQLRFGEPNTSPTWPRYWLDAMAVADEAALIGPVPAPPAADPRFPLDDRYELDLGAWTDITPWVYDRAPVGITRGRSAEADTADPSKMTLTLDNRDGRFSARNPVGPWFGLLGRNTPIRASLPFGETYLAPGPAEGDGASTPDAAALDITGDIDIRIEFTATNRGALIDLCGKRANSGDQRSWNFALSSNGFPWLFWNTTGASGGELDAFPSEPLPASDDRAAVRVALDVDNEAGGYTATFYTADSIAGPWTQLGDPVTATGTTSVFASTAPLEVGCCADGGGEPVRGRVHAAQVFDGIDGTAVAAPDFTVQTAGDASFTDEAGLTWTMQGAAHLDDRAYRFHGEVPSWPATYALDGVDDYVRIAASGITRRLGQNPPTLRSTMFRAHTNPALTSVLAYWPCEDGASATQLASGRPGGSPMEISGAPTLADYDGWTASDAMPTMGTGRFAGTVPPYTASGEISVYCFIFPPGGAISAETSLLRVHTTGTAALWDVRILANGNLRTNAYDTEGVALTDSSTHGLGDEVNFQLTSRGFSILKLQLVQNGSDIDWETSIIEFTNTESIGETVFTVGFNDTTLTGRTAGRVTRVILGDGQGLGDTKISHIVVSDDVDRWLFGVAAAIRAFNGENPTTRISRVCGEEGLEFASYSHGKTGNFVVLGDQLDKSLLDLLREAETADLGILFEPRDFLGFAYRSRPSLYNQTPAITLDWSAGQIAGDLTPVDDLDIRNDITAKRIAGSSVRVEQTTGPMSVQAPPDGVGRYDTKADLSLESDVQLADQAAWRLHLGTVDEDRYPTLTVNLRAPGLTSEMVDTILALDVGDRIDLTGLPAPDDVGLIVQGYAETLRLMAHVIVFHCAPASPWQIGVVEEDGLDRVDTGGSELVDAVTSTGTELLVASTAGPEWTVDGQDMPMDVMVAGERVTVTTVGELLNAASNPFVDGDVSGYVANNGAVAFSTAVDRPDAATTGGTALFTPDGASATGGIGNSLTPVGSITPDVEYTVSSWVYSPGGWSNHRVHVNWHDSSGTYLSSTFGPATDVPAATWTHLQATLTAPASASQAGAWASQGSSPSGTDEWHAWAVKLVDTGLVDGFDRIEVAGWGSSPDGRAWTTYGADSDYSVTSGLADIAIGSAGTADVAGLALDTPAVDFEVTFDAPADPVTGDALYVYLLASFDQAAFSWYALRIAMWGDGTMRLLIEVRDASGVTSALTSEKIAPSVTVGAGVTYKARFAVQGGVQLGKLWDTADSEPLGWQIVARDTQLTRGDIGMQAWVPPGNTNTVPVTFQFGEVRTRNPQTFTVVRSVNGVEKAQSTGADIAIAEPVYIAL